MNRKNKIALLLCVLGMMIGFASVSTVLYLNGKTNIVGNADDFDVYFSKAIENGKENNNLIVDKTHIEFTTELSKVGEQYVLNYDVTNGSQNYDAEFEVNYVGETSNYISIQNTIDTENVLKARETRSGKIVITLLEGVLQERNIQINFEIKGNAIERRNINDENIKPEDGNYLAQAFALPYSSSKKNYLWSKFDSSRIKKIVFMNTKNIPEELENKVILSWDASEQQNGSIIAYAVPYIESSKDIDLSESIRTPEDEDMVIVYIGQDGGVKANPSSHGLHMEKEGLENLDTSNVTNLSYFFSSEVITQEKLNLIDTSNVTNMTGLFYKATLSNIDFSQFDTSKVTNMEHMFEYADLTEADLSGLDTSNVTDMEFMFSSCKSSKPLDLSMLNVSKVTEMSFMFNCAAIKSLNVSTWDTSNVTSMYYMFAVCKELTDLDISGWNTRNVMSFSGIFLACTKLKTTLTVVGTTCTAFEEMFDGAATEENSKIVVNYTVDASDLVDQMIATKSSNSNVIKGEELSKYTITIADSEAITSNVNEAYSFEFITLSPNDNEKKIVSFKLNGKIVYGNAFKMPSEDVTITDAEQINRRHKITVLGDDAEDIFFPSNSDGTALEGDNVSVWSKTRYNPIVAFKLNGKRIEGKFFTMPGTDVTISDVEVNLYHSITVIGNDDINAPEKAVKGQNIYMGYTSGYYKIVSFRVNGKKTTKIPFTMPDEDVFIRDIEVIRISHDIIVEGNSNVTANLVEANKGTSVILSTIEENKAVVSFKLNGTLVNGASFTMPDEDAIITDIELKECVFIESEHNPYGDNLDDVVMGEKTFEGAHSLTVILEYETESTTYDWIYLYDSAGKKYGKYGGSRKSTLITIPGNYIKIILKSDEHKSDYYGFKAAIIPNYD